ncbi:hypothetical protein BDN67DRAFT_1015286 [Paxillus ammoniavirescens]|nr:hypothetical protein BDN67DRAFT_1015286 [Paxillus ammoniavirescens]
MQGLEVPLDLPLCLTDLIANYMLDRLRDYMHPDPAILPSVPSPFIPVYAMQQVDRFAEMLVLTYNNPGGSVMLSAWTAVLIIPVVININVKCVQEALNAHDYGMNAKQEADLLRRFNMPEIPPIMGPAVLVDTAGVVLLWSLPEVLSSHFQDLMWGALSPINAMLSCSVSEPMANGTWRIVHGNFDGAEMQGCLNFSPAWFQQGRNMSLPAILPNLSIFLTMKSGFHCLSRGFGHPQG